MLSVRKSLVILYFRREGAGDINIHVDVHTYLTFDLQLKIR